MDTLTQMYQQLILDHSKHPIGRGEIATPKTEKFGQSHQINPACGDEITLQVEVANRVDEPVSVPVGTAVGGSVTRPDQLIIGDVCWEGEGCSISQASASIMSELVTGMPVSEVLRLDHLFHDLMNSRGKGLPDADEDELGDATAFTGVSQYPARIKCALLGWVALRDSLVRAGALTADAGAKE